MPSATIPICTAIRLSQPCASPASTPIYTETSPLVLGFEVLNACFDAALQRDPRLIAFGEDVGRLGDVNQGFRGLQEKYGPLRVADTGIREATILGQAIGMALRGLRPIAEIQYLDYLLYALQIMSDDLATLHWRTNGGQKAPVIVRTRGHRLEGIWHSGSPMAGIIHLVRGMHVLVPRDMTQAAGFYNTLLRSDEPAIVVEVLNGYRQRGEAARKYRRVHRAAGRAGSAPRGRGCHPGDLRRLLPDRAGGRRAAEAGGHSSGSDRRAEPAAVRSAWQDRRVAQKDRAHRFHR